MTGVGTRALAIGDHALRALSGGGSVAAVFSRAAYLDCGTGLAALVPADVPDGPLHVRVDRLPDLAVDMPVSCDDGRLRVGDHAWLLPDESWLPPAAGDLLAAEPLISRLVDHEPSLSLSADDAPLDDWLVPLLGAGELDEAVARLVGRGAGLTPAGDDVAAGLLLVGALTGWYEPARLGRVAAGAATHEISRAFLRAAADGQGIESVHALLVAASAGDAPQAARAMGQLADIGHTSGLDLAAGVRAALVGYRLWVTAGGRAPRDVASIHAHNVP